MRPASAIAVASLSGLALNLAFPEPDAFWVAWIAIAPFLFVLRGAGAKRGAVLGMAFGVTFFGALLSWISIVGWVAWFLLVVMEAAFLGAFGLLWGWASRDRGAAARVIVPALLWVAIEYLRSVVPVVGFTWGELAQTQHNFPFLLKIAGVGGGWLIASFLVAANALVLEVVLAAKERARRPAALAAGALVLMGVAPAAVASPDATGSSLRVAIVQGNVPDIEPSFEKDLLILGSHVARTKELEGTVDLVVWPESSVGIDPFRNEEVAASMLEAADAVGAPIVIGGNLDLDDDRYQVMAYLVEPGRGIVDRYQKTHLVPFGEYVPGRRFLDWLPMLDQVPRDAIAGDEPTLFQTGGGAVAPVLSFEGDFGSLVRGRIDEGGRLLIVATNTSTWGRSWASAQHAAFSRVRAAENGVWVIHAALSGISEFVAPDGEVTDRTGLYEGATLTQELRFAEDTSFYARTGDWVPWGSLGISALWLLWVAIAAKRSSTVT